MTEQRLKRTVASWRLEEATRQRLAGDVSRRVYYRLTGRALDPYGGTAVVMLTPDGEGGKMRDWIAIGEWLARHGVPVPELYRRDDQSRVLLIGDVGDILLTGVDDPAAADESYRTVLTDLARLEVTAALEPHNASPAHSRRLDEVRIRWELRRFRKVVAGAVNDLGDAELVAWKEGEDRMVAALMRAPAAWMHRDLHARNLLIHDDRTYWIDFQDAMIGPWLYDVVSLLLDPYAALPENRRAAHREFYLSLPGRIHGAARPEQIERLWRVCAVQRLVHCLACYVWVFEQQHKDTYLPYLPYALAQLEQVIGDCAESEPLAQVMESRWEGARERWSRDAVRC